MAKNESGNKKKETNASNLESQISSFLETAKKAPSKVNLDMKSFKCKECNKTFQRYEVLQTHLKGAHQKSKPLKCNICQDSFISKTKLRKHIDEVHQNLGVNILHKGTKMKSSTEILT